MPALLVLALSLQDLSAADAIARMKPYDGFEVTVAASEPEIRQPVTITFDDRGRLWVLQYLQYPSPAGLQAVKVDRYLRTVYDKLPEPPPKGPRGADRVTILEDVDGDGRFEKAKDFVDGLNLASGMCLGRGGIYVAQPPYLLFYPDKNRDDVPDGDPEVLLTGFGMEDAHAFANSLQWGPDGWLYGAHGSTVTAKIRGIEFQQGIWRYHPVTKAFELFAEGGGNTWGVDFDRHGNLLAGTNFGNFAMLHQVQGAYYLKGFTKHGPLHNPHTYGYFDHVPQKDFKGGHVTCGGTSYQGGAFPAEFDDLYLACNPLSNDLYGYRVERNGSTFKSTQVLTLVQGNDPWFRPIDTLIGPDGALYVADWYDKRLNHVDPRENWDRRNGRVYRVAPKGLKPAPSFDLSKHNPAQLSGLLSHRNVWFRREARRLLVERGTKELPSDVPPLERVWILPADEANLNHPDEAVRAWTVRLLGDVVDKPDRLVCLQELARTEPSPLVRAQLACTAKRLPAGPGLAIVRELLKRGDQDDPFIPLLTWWAIEDKVEKNPDEVLALADGIAPFFAERIARRFMAVDDHVACAQLLKARSDKDPILRGFDLALQGRRLPQVPQTFGIPFMVLMKRRAGDPLMLRTAYRMGDAGAEAELLRIAADPAAKPEDRVAFIEILGQTSGPALQPALLEIIASKQPDKVRLAAVAACEPAPLVEKLPTLDGALRARALNVVLSRPASALALLKAVDASRVPKELIKADQLQGAAGYEVEELTALIRKHYGAVGRATEGAKQARIHNSRNALGRLAPDVARGKALFTKLCANCHTLFGEGGKVAPDLTGADRKNIDFMLTNVIDPSALIRPEFQAFKIRTSDGQILTGLAVEQTASAVTLVDAQVNKIQIPRDRIDAMLPSELSLMPEGLLDPLDDQETADLFGYLRSDPPQKQQGMGDPLPGTAPLKMEGDLAAQMVEGIDRFLLREIDASPAKRKPTREKLKAVLGLVDERAKGGLTISPTPVGRGTGYAIRAVRWPVFRGVYGEGLLLEPEKNARSTVILLPDADQTPEQLAGLAPGLEPERQLGSVFAALGSRVLIPTLLDRGDSNSVSYIGRATNQPHREFAYRPAFMMGRTVLGYEVQKALALVDLYPDDVAILGIGEGGFVALLAAAVEPRIEKAAAFGWFASRQRLWEEPIYRNLFGFLSDFGDAEIAGLIAPRPLHVAPWPGLKVDGPPAARAGRGGAAPGFWSGPDEAAQNLELDRLGLKNGSWNVPVLPTTIEAAGAPVDAVARQKRQLDEILADTQVLLAASERARNDYVWKKVSRKSVAEFEKSTEALRTSFYDDVIGRFDLPLLPANARSRKIYDEPKYVGYEVVLDVWQDVYAYGILLLPKDLKPGEKRAVVVCQHGLEGRPQDVADPKAEPRIYERYACKLAEKGYITFSPQNPYIGKDKFRALQRKANLLGKHLFSFIIPQHEQITAWLAAQSFVDPERIAFYGLSYGGKTAMRVPAVVKRYCASICSADFNEWIRKNASLDNGYTYVTTGEYEIFEWNLGNTFNYAEMAALIAPRPFMVERGHGDGVAPDEWVAYEFAKVKRLYVDLGIADRAEIEFFNGPHKINGVGTFKFLDRVLAK
ncbi:MAG TPA: PVC-type heme-binding CxxCH protein [Planctomycetota bacterium]